MFDNERMIEIINGDAKHLLELWKVYQTANDSGKKELEYFITHRIQIIIRDTERNDENADVNIPM